MTMPTQTIVPKVGMGATVGIGTDMYPATVIFVVPFKTGAKAGSVREVQVQFDRSTVVGGTWPDLQYEYSPEPSGRLLWFRVNTKGQFRCNGIRIGFGHRRRYNDPHF